jgi:hypothetical protein
MQRAEKGSNMFGDKLRFFLRNKMIPARKAVPPCGMRRVNLVPLPGLDKHLLAIQRQDEAAARAALQQVQQSFRQRWAEKILERK